MAELHKLVYSEYLATLPSLTDRQFDELRRHARDEYNAIGKLVAPWLSWRPAQRPILESWRQHERRLKEDPAYAAMISRSKERLMADVRQTRERIAAELELRRAIRQQRDEEAAKYGRRPPQRAR